MLALWWEPHAADIDDDGELYALLCQRVETLEELARLTKDERGSVVRMMRASAGRWHEVVVRTGRAESTLRGHAKTE